MDLADRGRPSFLGTNLAGHGEAGLWHTYMQLNDAEAAFRVLEQSLSIRPLHYQTQDRVCSHVLAYALLRTLGMLAEEPWPRSRRLEGRGPG